MSLVYKRVPCVLQLLELSLYVRLPSGIIVRCEAPPCSCHLRYIGKQTLLAYSRAISPRFLVVSIKSREDLFLGFCIVLGQCHQQPTVMLMLMQASAIKQKSSSLWNMLNVFITVITCYRCRHIVLALYLLQQTIQVSWYACFGLTIRRN